MTTTNPNSPYYRLLAFALCYSVALMLAVFLSSCAVATKLTKTGFNGSHVFTMAGATYSVDSKFVHRISSDGVYTRYHIDDPKVAGWPILSRIAERERK